MTDKQITEKQTHKIISDVFEDYTNLYASNRMDFREFAIIENILIKLQLKFKEVFEND